MAQEPAAASASIADATLRYGQPVVVRGAAPAGTPVVLEYRAADAEAWKPVARSTAGRTGRYRLAVALSRSGAVRVTAAPGPATAAGFTAAAGGSAVVPATHTVRVAARLRATSARLNVTPGHKVRVRGTLRRPRAGRVVALEAQVGNGWKTLDRARTSASGQFRLSAAAKRSAVVRLRFSGDALNASSRRTLGRMRVFRRSFASWYGPGLYGNRTACGQTFHAGIMGVAHKTLPCGSRVTFKKGARVVRARVVDRGPFVGGREFDLSPAVKAALGFGSTGPVWVAT
ncbi:MAG: hypothetical protein JHC95_20620 [Solirubrobacteraceae bacterium]|nr:hypothetical protein [Solirubrobacteraceae bacterium]